MIKLNNTYLTLLFILCFVSCALGGTVSTLMSVYLPVVVKELCVGIVVSYGAEYPGGDGKEQIVRFARKGDIIGYRALLGGGKYFASASVIEDAVICWFPKDVIEELLHSNPKFVRQTISLLSKDLRIAEQIILNMAQKPVRNRIAEVLLMLKEYYGINDISETINATLSREDIANIAGTSTETCIRILSEFNSDSVIKIIGKSIKITNIPKLLQIANVTE